MASKGSGARYRVTKPFSVTHFAIVTGAVVAVVALGGLAQATLGFGNLILIGVLVPVAVRFYLIKRTALMVAPNGVTVDGRSTPWYEVSELVVVGPRESDVVEIVLRRRQDVDRFFARGRMQRSQYSAAELRDAFERFAPSTANLSGWGFEDTGQTLEPQAPGPPPPSSRGRRGLTIRLAALMVALVVGGTIGAWVWERRNDDRERDRVRQQLQESHLADVLVRARGQDPASLLETVQALPDVEAVAPLVEGHGQISGAGGLGDNGRAAVVTNWIPDEILTPYQLIEGRGPRDPYEILIDDRTARESGVLVGDTILLQPRGTTGPEDFTVVGIASLGALGDICETPFVFLASDAALDLVAGADASVGVLANADAGVPSLELVETARGLPNADVLDHDALVTDRMERCE